MLLKNCIYALIILISLSSLVLMVFSIKNKNKHVCKIIKIIDIIYILYLICIFIIQQGDPFSIDYPLDILIYEEFGAIALLLFLASIIICTIKKKKMEIDIKSKKASVIMIILLAMPVISFMTMYFREKYLIANSDLILVYKSGSGFNSFNFAYAINNDYCEKVSIGTSTNGYSMKDFLPRDKTYLDGDLEYFQTLNTQYEIKYDEEERKILIYKNGKCIHKEKINDKYYSIDLKRIFVITNKN